MRKSILSAALITLVFLGGCRGIYGAAWKVPKFVDGKVLNIYTGNGHYDGKQRWDNFTRNLQQIQNFADIHFLNYDVRDPYVNAPFFGDPR